MSDVRAFVAAFLLALAGFADSHFAPRPEMVLRHEAERARWHADRNEAHWTTEQTRTAFAEIARRFGPVGEPSDAQRASADYGTRQAIAGSSALYSADLTARLQGASIALAEEYSSIADRWANQPDLQLLGRLREGATLQRIGDRHGALAAYRDVQRQGTRIDARAFPWSRELLIDLEVHVALLALELESDTDAAQTLTRARALLRRRAEDLQGRPEGRLAIRREAEIAFLAGDTEAALAGMESLCAQAASPRERAELQLALGEMHQYARHDPRTAEAWYRKAVQQGPLEPAAAEARVRLAELSLEQGEPQIGVRTVDELLTLGARVLKGRESEARYWRGRCLLELGRWMDALPAFEEGAKGDPGSPFTLACAARVHRRVSEFRSEETKGATARLLAVAAQVPPPSPVEVPQDWAEAWREDRAAFAWKEGVEELSAVARQLEDPGTAAAAREAAGRILRERTIFAQKTPDDASIGRR